MDNWHSVIIKYNPLLYNKQILWCYQNCGREEHDWDVDVAKKWIGFDLTVTFWFREQGMSLQFELTYG